ncbi:MAG: hypothetical protein K0B08_02065 [Bacteroidales bacterium]|nr:hypothetical protein [Bacteroidales bacterium]
MMKRSVLLIALFISILQINAQKQANYWYFGQYAGLNFGMGIPVALTNGALSTGEGCSSISTSAGNLEFYTDGRFVYDRNHNQMPNGSGLYGHSSSTQSGIIVPKPGSTTQYYIFTVDAYDNNLANGLCYSRVDITLNNGFGDVVVSEKNISLVPLTCEKVTAVGHSDGFSFWVITKKWGNADFYVYRITSGGVNTTPVISTTGPPLIGDMQASKGYLKVSPDGTKIASANNTDFSVGIYNFNNTTGVVTHLVTDYNYINPGGWDPGGPYGVEFSPNSTKLYIGEWKANRRVSQYDLTSGDPTAILNSKVIVGSVGQGSDPIGAIQLGPDNRLYIARYGSTYLSRINQPNVQGSGCGFIENAIGLAGRQCRYGLPPFIQSFFYLTADFYWDEPACDGFPTQFYTSASDDPDSVKWTFPDGTTSTLLNPTFLFPGTGLYGVTLVVYLYGQSKTVLRFVQIRPNPEVSLGNDTTVCLSEAFYLDAGEHSSYLWHNGETTQTILTDMTGWYWCQVANEWGCTAIDSVYLTVNPNPLANAGPEKTIPEGTTTTLEGSVSGGSGSYSYQWQPAALLTNPNALQPTTVAMTTTTLFTLTITDNQTGCTGEDEVLITVMGGVLTCNPYASPNTICRGEQSHLHTMASGGSGDYSYSWSSNPPGFTSQLADPVVTPDQTTTYTVSVDDGEYIVNGNVTVTVHQLPVPNAGPDQSIPFGTPTVLQGSASQGTGPYYYQWEPSDLLVSANVPNPTTLNLTASTIFTLHVTDLGTGCACEQDDFVVINVTGDALSAYPSVQPGTICSGQPAQLFALAGGGAGPLYYSYSWTSNPPGFNTTEENPIVMPYITTTYTVTVSDTYNQASGSTTLTVNPTPYINLGSGNEQTVCVFDTVTLDAGSPGSSYLWSNGSTDQIIKIATTGIGFDVNFIQLTVTSPQGCVATAQRTIYFDFAACVGIDDLSDEAGFRIFPNPGKGLVNIQQTGNFERCFLTVTDKLGREIIKNQEIVFLNPDSQFTIDLSESPPGLYTIRLTGTNSLNVARKYLLIR